MKAYDFLQFQNKSLDTVENANLLTDMQTKFVNECLKSGLALYEEYKSKNHNHPTAYQFFILFENYFSYVLNAEKLLENRNLFVLEQEKLYAYIHDKSSNLTDEIKVFFEFMLGLVRIDLAAQLGYLVLCKLGAKLKPLDEYIGNITDFFQHLEAVGKMMNVFREEISRIYLSTEKYLQYWDDVAHCLKQNPQLSNFAKCLNTMQFIPEDLSILAIAQVLHWLGWGGDGSILKKYFSDKFPTLLQHCIYYISDQYSTQFSKLISLIVSNMHHQLHAAMITYCKSCHNTDEIIKIADFGSGPQNGLVKAPIQQLISEGYNIHLDALDICSPKPSELPNRCVFYYDLNYPHQHDINKYDITCAGFVLHQLANPKAAIQDMVYKTKPDGAIFIVEIRDQSLQFLSFATNLADREGNITDYNFWELSTELDDDFIKFPYPILILNQNEPANQPNITTPLWCGRTYVVIEYPKAKLDLLKEAWLANNIDQCNALINQFSKSHIDIKKLIEHWETHVLLQQETGHALQANCN